MQSTGQRLSRDVMFKVRQFCYAVRRLSFPCRRASSSVGQSHSLIHVFLAPAEDLCHHSQLGFVGLVRFVVVQTRARWLQHQHQQQSTYLTNKVTPANMSFCLCHTGARWCRCWTETTQQTSTTVSNTYAAVRNFLSYFKTDARWRQIHILT